MLALRSGNALLTYLVGVVRRAGVDALVPEDDFELAPDAGALEVWQTVAGIFGITMEEVAHNIANHCRMEVADVKDIPQHVLKLVPDHLARQYAVLPVREGDRHLDVATSDPTDLEAEQAIGFASGRSVTFLIAPPDELDEAIEHYYAPEKAVQSFVDRLAPMGTVEFTVVEAHASDDVDASEADSAPVIQLTNLILRDAIYQDASDIHFEPGKGGGSVRFRVDGVLRHYMRLPMAAMIRVSSRIKILSKLDIADRLRPQDGRAAIVAEGARYDLRVSTVPTRDGEKIVIRILNPGSAIGLDDLHMTGPELDRFRALLRYRDGLILVTGPTGSGKTTTLYAGIRELSTGEQNIMTVEDPVEYELDSINQIQIEPKKGVTFATALRAILRQDPDVIFVGEIRDGETAEIAVQACMTGHLVLATLHTNDALGAVKRLGDLGVDEASIAATLRGAIAQRLVRRVCPDCHVPVTGELTAQEKILVTRNGIEPKVRTVGCSNCSESGYRGRYPVCEVITITTEMQTLIARRAPHLELRREAKRAGFRAINESVADHVVSGVTTLEEVERVIGRVHGPAEELNESPSSEPQQVSPEATRTTSSAGKAASSKRTTKKTVRKKRSTRSPTGTEGDKGTRTTEPRAEGGSPPSPDEGIHILLVEDDPVTRKQAKRLLTNEGYHVTEAVDGEHAMSRLEAKADYALVVLDLYMPRLDGRSVLTQVRGNVSTAGTPIVVLTSSTDPETEIEMMEAGADDYIRKPIDPPYFHARIRGALLRAGLV